MCTVIPQALMYNVELVKQLNGIKLNSPHLNVMTHKLFRLH